MGAFVEHSFERPFLLEEAGLRKIRETLQRRIEPRHAASPVKYKVYRGDSFSYETDSVDDVVHEDNEDWRRITRLEILVDDGDHLQFVLRFSDQGCSLEITGEDRDEVFLLFSDLREYIQNEVAVVKRLPRVWVVSLPILLAGLGVVWGLMVIAFLGPSASEHSRALSTTDIQEKLNFLLEASAAKVGPRWSFALLLGAMLLISIGMATNVFERVYQFLSPGNQFLFGARKTRYERRRALVGRLYWGVGVALAVSVVAGWIVWLVTRGR